MDESSLLNAVELFFDTAGNAAVQIVVVPTLKPDRRLARVVTTDGSRYVAKMFDGPTDRYTRERDCLRCLPIAIAPTLFHANDTNGFLITEQFDGRQLHENAATNDSGIVAQCVPLFTSSLNLPVEHRPPTHHTLLLHYLSPNLAARIKLSESDLLGIADVVGKMPRIPCHRDFHPSNILVSPTGEVRLLDFESYGRDTPLLDIAKFCFNPALPLRLSERFHLVELFRNQLRLKLEFEFALIDLTVAAFYWAACCAGFYLRYHPAETVPGGRYHDLVTIPVELISQFRKTYI